MRAPLVTSLAALIFIVNPARGTAQDLGDIAAYAALSFTPVGGLVPLPPSASAARGSAFVLRYGNLELGDPSLHSFSFGGDLATAHGRFGLTVGASTCDGCDGNFMAGVDYSVPLTQNVLSVAVRPALGFMKPLEGGGTAVSLGLSLPVGVELSGATGPVFTPYLVPGLGYGHISNDGDSESGTRPMLGGGIAIAGRQSTFAVHLGFQKVFIEEGETTFGLGMSFGRRASSAR